MTPMLAPNYDWKFVFGQRVRKTKGSSWQGRVVGFYSTKLTPEGYAVESEREPGSVQIYPVFALETVEDVDETISVKDIEIWLEAQIAVNKVIQDNPDRVRQARERSGLSGWFVGQVMKIADGKIDPNDVQLMFEQRGIKI